MEKELILLGLLKEGPRHGYELKRIVDEKISTFAPISAGSIYYTLKGLEKGGLVSMTRKRRGKYPEKEKREVRSINISQNQHQSLVIPRSRPW